MKSDKQQQAQNLYFQTDLTQAEIAKLLDVNRGTIQNWMSDCRWRELKKSSRHVPSKLAEQFYFMLANLNDEVLSRGHQPYPLSHEVEEMRKISVCIKNVKNRQTVNESIEAFTHLAETISTKDPELAAKLRPHIQEYMKDRADFRLSDANTRDYKCDPKLGELKDYELLPFDPSEPEYVTTGPTTSPGENGVAVAA